jgi:hypothetical protein
LYAVSNLDLLSTLYVLGGVTVNEATDERQRNILAAQRHVTSVDESGARRLDMPNPVKRLVIVLHFYSRGGSAQVVRYLSSRLAGSFETRLYAGSLGAPGDLTHAGTFFAWMDPVPLD